MNKTTRRTFLKVAGAGAVTAATFGSGVFGSGSGKISVAPGDVVVFESGTYTDTNGDGSVMRIEGSGTATQWITFVSRTK